MKKLLIVIPAYNEEESLKRVADQLIRDYPQFDYVIINDGSRDRTLEICRKYHYRYVNLPVNLGLECGVRTGMRFALRQGYEYMIQYDADGQHLPEYIPEMLKTAEEGYNIVIGSRFVSAKKDRSARMLGSRLISGAIRLATGQRIKDPTSGMRMYDRKSMEAFEKIPSLGPEPDMLSFLMKNGFRVKEVQVEMKERETGSSYLTITRSISYMLRMLISILLIQNYKKR